MSWIFNKNILKPTKLNWSLESHSEMLSKVNFTKNHLSRSQLDFLRFYGGRNFALWTLFRRQPVGHIQSGWIGNLSAQVGFQMNAPLSVSDLSWSPTYQHQFENPLQKRKMWRIWWYWYVSWSLRFTWINIPELILYFQSSMNRLVISINLDKLVQF